MPTARGWTTLVGGLAVCVAAAVFGAQVLLVLGTALVLGPPAAVAWVRLGRRGAIRMGARLQPLRPIEGMPWTCELHLDGGVPRGATLRARILDGDHDVVVERADAGGMAVVHGVAGRRGRHPSGRPTLRVADPLGLARVERLLPAPADAIVWLRVEPRAVREATAAGGDARRRGVRTRPVGFDLHGIREHRPGESLRRVDWKTSARTGELMVRELEDGSHLDVVLVVDPGAVTGVDPDRLDALLRAAAAEAVALARIGVRAALVVVGADRVRVPLDEAGAEALAMDALSLAEPGRRASLPDLLARDPDVARAAAVRVHTPEPASLAAWAARLGDRVAVDVIGPEGEPPAAVPALEEAVR